MLIMAVIIILMVALFQLRHRLWAFQPRLASTIRNLGLSS
jgi:hypothetical protein